MMGGPVLTSLLKKLKCQIDILAGLKEDTNHCVVNNCPSESHANKMQVASRSWEWLQSRASKKTVTQFYNHQEPNSSNNPHNFERWPWVIEEDHENRNTVNTLILALWDYEQRTQLACAWTLDLTHRKYKVINMCYFKPLSLWQFCDSNRNLMQSVISPG